MLSALLTFVISAIYSVPSILLYLFTIYIIFRYRKSFDSSFFTLYLYDGAMNLFTYIVGFYMMRLNSITCDTCAFAFLYRNMHNYFPMNFLTSMSYHMAYVQYSTTALISFNRLSVLWNYKTAEPIWKKYTWLIMLIVFALPFLDTHRCFYYRTEIVYDEESESYALKTPMPINDNFFFLIPAMISITILSIGTNITSLMTVRTIGTQKRSKVEFNFVIIMSITCFVQFLGCALSVARVALSTHPLATTLAGILPFISDGLTLVQPWLLVGFSHAIRAKIRQMFGWQDTNVLVVRSMTS
ncbi:hypothetical protein GCK72_016644 [Caenorhabditis remanei]|uniref:Serpentine receptor class gamma n=1 Tax=Caenorhabditis remanei TaxID=31234 RepID=A0A6A5G511_CAERE|nr:hypothetical protein GCK72_016644 [Caenorhabditis remanei]KAF1750098.1 hypothetical protein GCK72_016644 [Caenorhabditis remanei]